MRHTFIRILFFTLLAVSLMSCAWKEEPKSDLRKPVPVKTELVTMQPLEQRLTYSGTVEPIEKVTLSTRLMGCVENIYFDEGDNVQKGTALIKLRSKDLEARRRQAEAGIDEAEAHFKNMEKNLKRIEVLFEKKAATQKELDDTRTAYSSARAGKIRAEEMKKEAEEMLRYTELKAPFDGTVTRKMREIGDLANPGQPILEIENNSKLKIVAKVPENEVQNLEIGMPVKIDLRALHTGTNGKSTESTIHKIFPSADPLSRQFDVQVLLDNPHGKIKSGMFARIAIGKTDRAALLVPQKAVFRRGQLQGLFTVDSKNKAHLRWIRTGAENHNLIEILSGLNPGEQVVVEGASLLMDGQFVEVSE